MEAPFDTGFSIVRRQAWWALPLRLIVGYGFMEHGYAKLAHGPDSFRQPHVGRVPSSGV